MELRHLRYFVAVVEELHFRKAAEKLYVAQPALSKQIQDLEDELGTQLLIRNRRGVALTDAGKVFYEDAVAVLARTEIAISRATATGKGLSGQFSIGFIQPAVGGLLQGTLREFRNLYPEVRLRVVEGSSRNSLAKVNSGELDCAFVRLPIDLPEEIAFEPVVREKVRLALPETHPLAAQADIALEDLATEELVLIERHLEPSLYDYYIGACNAAGFSPRLGQIVSSTWVALGVVAGGIGVCFAADSARSAVPPGIVFRDIRGDPLHLEMGIIWTKTTKSNLLENFLELRPWERRHEPAPTISGAGLPAKSQPS